MLIEVAFKGNRKEFFLWEGETAPSSGSSVIVDADRGEDLGRVHSVAEKAELRCRKCAHGLGEALPERKALRVATADDLAREKELRVRDEDARRTAMEQVRANGLTMKLSDAEWQWDRRKLTLYFTSEKRVDFRKLVRDLASTFKARIELKQIGVRDEAKRLDGVGRCGRQYCSASWLPELRPVNLGVAKDQKLSLNPSQISGACGRLMCSLRYEHEFYVQSRKRFPKEGRSVVAARGEEKVLYNDIFRDRVTLRNMEGDTRIVALLDLRAEIAELHRAAKEAGKEEVTRGERAEDWTSRSARQLPVAHSVPDDLEDLPDEDPVDAADDEDGVDELIITGEYAAADLAESNRGSDASSADKNPAPPSQQSAHGARSGGAASPGASPSQGGDGGEQRSRRKRGRRGGRRGKLRGGNRPGASGTDDDRENQTNAGDRSSESGES